MRVPTSAEAVVAEDERKAALRAAALAARRQLSPGERSRASAAVVARLLALPELRDARTVLLYAAMPEEVDLAGLVAPLHRRNARTLFPRVQGQRLDLVETSDLRTLQLGYRGIREPVGTVVVPDLVDAAVIPGVAFDPHGGRLGQGGGHYDRLLPRLPAPVPRIGVCFACQVVPAVPRTLQDEMVDVVVTERAIYRSNLRLGSDDPGTA